MIKQLKNGIIQGIGIVSVIGIFGITYAAVSQVSTGETLTAQIFNESMVPTGAVMAFNGSICPAGWNKADGSGDEKNTLGNLTTLDLRGEFIRGLDDGRGIDSGRLLATSQTDKLQGHSHELKMATWQAVGGSAYPSIGGYASNTVYVTINQGVGNATDIGFGTPRIGTETRPRNIALLYCVKN